MTRKKETPTGTTTAEDTMSTYVHADNPPRATEDEPGAQVGHPGRQWRETHNGAHVGHPQIYQTGQHNLIWRIVMTISLLILMFATRELTQRTQRLPPPTDPSAHKYRTTADTRQGNQPNTVRWGKGMTGFTVVPEMPTAIKATSNNQTTRGNQQQPPNQLATWALRVHGYRPRDKRDWINLKTFMKQSKLNISPPTTTSRCTRHPTEQCRSIPDIRKQAKASQTNAYRQKTDRNMRSNKYSTKDKQ